MANNALTLAWIGSGLAALHLGVAPPYFSLDSTNGLISLIVSSIFVTPVLNAPIIYINESLLQFFDAFPIFWYGINRPQGRDYDLILNDQSHPYYLPGQSQLTTNPPQYYQFTQEYLHMLHFHTLLE